MPSRVVDLMDENILTIAKSTSVVDAAKLMIKKDASYLIVVDDGNPLGIITDKDFVRRVIIKDQNRHIQVDKIMSKPLFTVNPELSIITAAQEMHDKKIKRLVVVKEGKVVGILTADSLVKNLNEITKITCATILGEMGKGSLMG